MNFLGIDVGTGGSRGVLIDGRGASSPRPRSSTSLSRRPKQGRAEQDTCDWWRASAAAVRAILSSDGVHTKVVGGGARD